MDSKHAMQACQMCGRMTRADRPSCLYCGAARTPEATSSSAADSSRRPQALPGFLLLKMDAGIPQEPSRADLEILGLDSYQWTRFSRRAGPFVISTVPEEEIAKARVDVLRRLGMTSLVLPQAELARWPYTLRAVRVIPQENGWTFFTTRGESCRLPKGADLLLVRGRVRVEAVHQEDRQRTRGSEMRALLEDRSDFEILEVFTENESLPPIRIKSSGFDFSFLGPNATAISHKNLETFVKQLQEHAQQPTRPIDEGFAQLEPLFSDSRVSGLFDPSADAPVVASDYRSTEKQFHQYARVMSALTWERSK